MKSLLMNSVSFAGWWAQCDVLGLHAWSDAMREVSPGLYGTSQLCLACGAWRWR